MTAAKPTAAPVVISDANALATTGLKPRPFRAFVREHGIPYARAGRRMLVRVDRLLEAIDRLNEATTAASTPWDETAAVEAAAKGSR